MDVDANDEFFNKKTVDAIVETIIVNMEAFVCNIGNTKDNV